MKRAILAIAALSILPVAASADDSEIVRQSCKTELKMSDSGCDCVLEKVGEFNDKQTKMFIAMITRNQAAMAQAQGELTGNEMQQLAMRMTQIPSECQ